MSYPSSQPPDGGSQVYLIDGGIPSDLSNGFNALAASIAARDAQDAINAQQSQLWIRKVRTKGISMPVYSGLPNESVEEFIFRAKLFMHGKNLNYHQPQNHQRVVAMMASNLKGAAASWYHTGISVDGKQIYTLEERATPSYPSLYYLTSCFVFAPLSRSVTRQGILKSMYHASDN
uniref:Uncharacterized protein n=1 Tax=Peronospora matthiolae TaxID=2874970 RepID=A0AAV1TKQ5_9STRA